MHPIYIVMTFILVITPDLFAASAKGNKENDKQVKTAFTRIDAGYSTYKSELVGSNDTGYSYGFQTGVCAGQSRALSVLLRYDSTAVDFELNTSKIETTWQDTIIRYRWFIFNLGVILARADVVVNKEGEDLFDADGTGYGGTFGFSMPITKTAVLYLDAFAVTYSDSHDITGVEVSVGSRTDVDIGASIDLTKDLLDFVFGYKYRALALTLDGTASAEVHTQTYLGLGFGFDF